MHQLDFLIVQGVAKDFSLEKLGGKNKSQQGDWISKEDERGTKNADDFVKKSKQRRGRKEGGNSDKGDSN